MLVFNRDKAELEAEFRNPGIPETGLPVEELKAGLLRLAGRKKDGSRSRKRRVPLRRRKNAASVSRARLPCLRMTRTPPCSCPP